MSESSQLGWVDFSSDDRERVRQVLSQLQEPGTLDELGIGALRDGFADRMFPGFSTIQTRAKYLITVPRMIRDYLSLKPKEQRKKSLDKYLRERENELARVLTELHGDNETGIIGSTKINSDGVARLPSSVYWAALRVWGIIDTTLSLSQFQREITLPESALGSKLEEEADDLDGLRTPSRIILDKLDPEWFEPVSIYLTASESQFLLERLHRGPANSLPTQLEQHGLMKSALEEQLSDFQVLAAWVAQQPALSKEARNTVRMAESFSNLIYGAHIRFNCLLAKRNERDELLVAHEELWQEWLDSIQADPSNVDIWLEYTGARLPSFTRTFLRDWSEALNAKTPDEQLDRLVARQANNNKGKRSLLQKRLPPDYTWVGMARLNYRWSNVRVILRDIQAGLSC